MSLFNEVRYLRRIAVKRNPMFSKNRSMRLFMSFFAFLWILVSIVYGFGLEKFLQDFQPGLEAFEVFNRHLIVLLFVDFIGRFSFQEKFRVEIRPFQLLPINRSSLIKVSQLCIIFTPYNFIWITLLSSFGGFSALNSFGITGVAGFVVGYFILIVINSYWFQICRILIWEKSIWVLMPVSIYSLLALTYIFPGTGFVPDLFMSLGSGFLNLNPAIFIFVAIITFVFYYISCRIQLTVIGRELEMQIHEIKHNDTRKYLFLDCFGDIGEYLRLEIRLYTRNAVPKALLRSAFFSIICFSLLLSYTDIYSDYAYMVNSIVLYNYILVGIILLSQIMSFEGNYLDGLMSRKESVLSILRTKYYFTLIFLLFPFFLSFIPIANGKTTLLTSVSYLFFTSGIILCVIMQLATRNQITLDLNTKNSGRNRVRNFSETFVRLSVMFVAPILLQIIVFLFGDIKGKIVIMLVGIAGTLLSPFWIKNLYNKIMRNKYETLNSFRATRN